MEQIMHRMTAPEGMNAVSFGGISYEVNDERIVEVPQEAAISLYPFGLTDAPAKSADDEPAADGLTDAPAKSAKKK